MAALLTGPTAAERSRAFRTAVPVGVRLLGVDLDGSIATVDASRGFVARRDTAVAGVAQLVYTAAFHESADVPAYAASHGCVRVPSHDARWIYGFARFGTSVDVV